MPATAEQAREEVDKVMTEKDDKEILSKKLTDAKIVLLKKFYHAVYDSNGGIRPADIEKEVLNFIGQKKHRVTSHFDGEGKFSIEITDHTGELLISSELVFF